ncbi:MAG: HAMP domain-containing sensor histidine kinase [Nitrospinota bacterium]|nr:HAMP domain-containing sensor histidine kinase [Nitrospinota bacterium]
MRRLRSLFHPIFVFIGVQIAWIVLMGIWINWYFKNNRKFTEFAQRLRPELFSTDFNWVVLLEGSILMLIILAGVLMIFVFWNKQARFNRMQSNFVASVSHELKSPLASIQLYLETMKYHKVSPQETKDFVETMLTDTERLSGLIDNILEAGTADPKRIELKFLPVEMGPFVLEVMDGHRRRFEEKDCRARIDIVDSPLLYVDKQALQMVFNNLISNALRYSSKGSHFSLHMHNNGKYCEIDFIDSGIGLEKKDLKNILKKFYRVQNCETQNIEGAGLGLFIAKETVKNHKGKLKVDSLGRGQGSKFTVCLPLNFVPKSV